MNNTEPSQPTGRTGPTFKIDTQAGFSDIVGEYLGDHRAPDQTDYPAGYEHARTPTQSSPVDPAGQQAPSSRRGAGPAAGRAGRPRAGLGGWSVE